MGLVIGRLDKSRQTPSLRLAFAGPEIPAALARLTDPVNGLLEQAAILSTCNRVELYGVSRSRPAEHKLVSFLAGYHGPDTADVASMLYVYRDDRVARHLAATAAGMISLPKSCAEFGSAASRRNCLSCALIFRPAVWWTQS